MELTFEDQHENRLPPIRRSVSRSNRGTLQEVEPNFSVLNIDPISFRLGTTMPALIPYIHIGKISELGKAVAELTGLSSLIDLAKHAGKVSKKISNNFTTEANDNLAKIDISYNEVSSELKDKFSEFPSITPEIEIPPISEDKDIENKVKLIKEHLEKCKAESFVNANSILGDEFDSSKQSQLKDLESKITPAISKLDEIKDLKSAARLSTLNKLNDVQVDSTEKLINRIYDEANILSNLASQPELAQRKKLYARVAEWIKEFDLKTIDIDKCPVCTHSLSEVIDPVTTNLVTVNITEALEEDSVLISKPIDDWISATLGLLAKDLEPCLQTELKVDLPNHPIDLIKSALTDELFSVSAFSGVISLLKSNMQVLYDEVFPVSTKLDSDNVSKLPHIIT